MVSFPATLLGVILMVAAAACLAMWRKGHFYAIVPLSLPLAWMSIACFLKDSLDHDDFALMMSLGLFVLCMSIIIGAVVYAYTRTRP